MFKIFKLAGKTNWGILIALLILIAPVQAQECDEYYSKLKGGELEARMAEHVKETCNAELDVNRSRLGNLSVLITRLPSRHKILMEASDQLNQHKDYLQEIVDKYSLLEQFSVEVGLNAERTIRSHRAEHRKYHLQIRESYKNFQGCEYRPQARDDIEEFSKILDNADVSDRLRDTARKYIGFLKNVSNRYKEVCLEIQKDNLSVIEHYGELLSIKSVELDRQRNNALEEFWFDATEFSRRELIINRLELELSDYISKTIEDTYLDLKLGLRVRAEQRVANVRTRLSVVRANQAGIDLDALIDSLSEKIEELENEMERKFPIERALNVLWPSLSGSYEYLATQIDTCKLMSPAVATAWGRITREFDAVRVAYQEELTDEHSIFARHLMGERTMSEVLAIYDWCVHEWP